MEEREIFFRRNDADTWALARLHHSLLLQIQDSPLWEREDIPDIPLTEEQMVSFVRGLDGVGRFVMGLEGNIEVMEGDELIAYLKRHAAHINSTY